MLKRTQGTLTITVTVGEVGGLLEPQEPTRRGNAREGLVRLQQRPKREVASQTKNGSLSEGWTERQKRTEVEGGREQEHVYPYIRRSSGIE